MNLSLLPSHSRSVLPVRSQSSWIWGLLAVVVLWLILINQLRLQWTAHAQYSYGWVMPLLCLGLLSRRWFDEGRFATNDVLSSGFIHPNSIYRSSSKLDRLLPWLFGFAAFLLFPLLLVLEANPDWRTINWLLACDVVGLTLLAIYYYGGGSLTRRVAFSVCFILLAVPWPVSLELPLIQGLTRTDVAATIECLGWFDIPAAQHGNVIEISTGLVGVSDACSGIRSFQSSLMISLFLGEFFRFSIARRLGLALAGVTLAFLFNICRTSLIVAVASKKGLEAIERWHDPTGLSISIACVLALWGLSLLLKARGNKVGHAHFAREHADFPEWNRWNAPSSNRRLRALPTHVAVGLFVWLVLVEATVEVWYRAHEMRAGSGPDWTLQWPPQEPGFREVPVSETAREMLSYSEGHCGAWTSGHGVEWLMYYFRWAPGRTAAFAARGHTPGVCLAAAGKTLRPIADNRCPIKIRSREFPFRHYEFEENGREVYVFHCLWEENAPGAFFNVADSAGMLHLRFEAVLQGRRNLGQRSLELVITGVPDLSMAREAAQQQLQKLITVVGAPGLRLSDQLPIRTAEDALGMQITRSPVGGPGRPSVAKSSNAPMSGAELYGTSEPPPKL